MKRWIFPAIAIGIAVFLMTERGREVQENIADNIGDWSDQLLKLNRKAQEKLAQVQSTLEHFTDTLDHVANG
jgi:transcriptional regulator